MFFYLYAIIELIAFFLDSNIIPTANASYPVSPGTVLFRTLLRTVRMYAIVVCSIVHRSGRGRLLLPSYQRVRGLSVRRGWHTVIIMGTAALSFPSIDALKLPRVVVFTDLLPCCLWCLVFYRHCDLQGFRGIQKYSPCGTLDYLYSLACDLHSHLRRLTTDPGLPYA